MSRLPSQPEDQHDTLPDALAADLRAIYGRGPDVPHEVDAAILREARAGFARRRRFRLAFRAAMVDPAAAAAVVLAFAVPILMKSDPRQQQAGPTPWATDTKMLMVSPPSQPEDVDHSGKVDILDAFVVAKLIEVRRRDRPTYDVNGDGRSTADVDRIAMAAVDTSADAADRTTEGAMTAPSLRGTIACVGRARAPRAWCSAAVAAHVVAWASSLRSRPASTPRRSPSPARRSRSSTSSSTRTASPSPPTSSSCATTAGDVKLVGIEGGEHAAFAQPPYYDPKALLNERIVIAAFNTAGADKLPSGKTRVARLMVRVDGETNRRSTTSNFKSPRRPTPSPSQAIISDRRKESPHEPAALDPVTCCASSPSLAVGLIIYGCSSAASLNRREEGAGSRHRPSRGTRIERTANRTARQSVTAGLARSGHGATPSVVANGRGDAGESERCCRATN